MSEIADFLRARYAEARNRANAVRRPIPSVFDGRDVEITYQDGVSTLLVDGHPFPQDRYYEIATESAPDPDVIADLDAKLALVDELDAADPNGGYITAAFTAHDALKILAQTFAGHPDHKGEEWAP